MKYANGVIHYGHMAVLVSWNIIQLTGIFTQDE